MKDEGKVGEREHNIQGSKARVLWKSSDTNRGIWFGNVVIKCTGEEKNRSVSDDVLRNICGIRRVDRETQ